MHIIYYLNVTTVKHVDIRSLQHTYAENLCLYKLTVVFALLPHERAPLTHRVVPLAVLALDPQDVKEGGGGAKTVTAVDLRVQILKSKNYIKYILKIRRN